MPLPQIRASWLQEPLVSEGDLADAHLHTRNAVWTGRHSNYNIFPLTLLLGDGGEGDTK